jgi:hypothetical protein
VAIRKSLLSELLRSRGAPLEVVVEQDPRAVLYIPRRTIIYQWGSTPSPRSDVAVIAQGGVPSPEYCALLWTIVREWDAPLVFVGGLDPFDLLALAVLVSWNQAHRKSAVRLAYGGIDDRWLRLCREELSAPRRISQLLIEMESGERKCLEMVEAFFPRLDTLVGAQASKILRSGKRFGLEGAVNAALYRRGFSSKLRRHLLRLVDENLS